MKTTFNTVLAFALFSLAACSSSDDPVLDVEAPEFFSLQVLHASPDAPAVNVFVDGGEVLSAVDYKVGSGFISNAAGTYEIRVDGILPGGDATVIGPVDLTFEGDTIYTIAAVGPAAPGAGTGRPGTG